MSLLVKIALVLVNFSALSSNTNDCNKSFRIITKKSNVDTSLLSSIENIGNERLKAKLKSPKGAQILLYLSEIKNIENTYFDHLVIENNWDIVLKYFPNQKDNSSFYIYLKSFFGGAEVFHTFIKLKNGNRVKKTEQRLASLNNSKEKDTNQVILENRKQSKLNNDVLTTHVGVNKTLIENINNLRSDRLKGKLKSKKGMQILLYLSEIKNIEPLYFNHIVIEENWNIVLKYFPTQKNNSTFYSFIKSFFGGSDILHSFTGLKRGNRVNKSAYLISSQKDLNEKDSIIMILQKIIKEDSSYSGKESLVDHTDLLKKFFHFENTADLSSHINRLFGSNQKVNNLLFPLREDLKNNRHFIEHHKVDFLRILAEKGIPKNINFKKNQYLAKKILDNLTGYSNPISVVRNILRRSFPSHIYQKFLIKHKRSEFSIILKENILNDTWIYDLNEPRENFNHLRRLIEKILGHGVGYGKVVKYILKIKMDEFNFNISEIHRKWAETALAHGSNEEKDTDLIKKAYSYSDNNIVIIDEISNPERILSSDDTINGLQEIASEIDYADQESILKVLVQITLKSNYDLNNISIKTGIQTKEVSTILELLYSKKEILHSLF